MYQIYFQSSDKLATSKTFDTYGAAEAFQQKVFSCLTYISFNEGLEMA